MWLCAVDRTVGCARCKDGRRDEAKRQTAASSSSHRQHCRRCGRTEGRQAHGLRRHAMMLTGALGHCCCCTAPVSPLSSPRHSETQNHHCSFSFSLLHTRLHQLSPPAHMTILRCKVAIVGPFAGTSPSVASRSVAASASVGRCLLTHPRCFCSSLFSSSGDCKVGKSSLTASFHKGKQYNKNYVMVRRRSGIAQLFRLPIGSAPDPRPNSFSFDAFDACVCVHMLASRLLALSSL